MLVYRPNFAASILWILSILAAVIIVPDLDAPGIRAKTCKMPINKHSKNESEEIFFFNFKFVRYKE